MRASYSRDWGDATYLLRHPLHALEMCEIRLRDCFVSSFVPLLRRDVDVSDIADCEAQEGLEGGDEEAREGDWTREWGGG